MTDAPSDPVEPPFGEPARPVFGGSRRTAGPAPVGLQGRLAVVTGASGLLGAAVARELCARGAAVCLLGRDLSALDDTAQGFPDGTRTAVLQCDLAVSEDIVSAVEFVQRLDRPVDLVVHAAGLQSPSHVADGPVESLDEHYLLNVRGPYLLSQQLLPLVRDESGRFAFFAGADGPARPGDAHHAITQAAGRALADELRAEAARRGIGVVTVVAGDEPAIGHGAVDTARFAAALAQRAVDSLIGADLDVTELRVRGIARPVRGEQR